ncbi:MAG: hypothetical protein ACO25N_02915 [Candidatus Limnocylindrus sp.]
MSFTGATDVDAVGDGDGEELEVQPATTSAKVPSTTTKILFMVFPLHA